MIDPGLVALAAPPLTKPERLWSRSEILSRPSPVPAEAGVYAWYIKGLPASTAPCQVHLGYPMVYVGIAPSRANSASTLRKRLRQHMRGNAAGSTLRLSLGSLLRGERGIALEASPSGRLTFGSGEAVLNDWLDNNAKVAWLAVGEPWDIEPILVSQYSLPLNIEHNEKHPFRLRLQTARKDARMEGRTRSAP